MGKEITRQQFRMPFEHQQDGHRPHEVQSKDAILLVHVVKVAEIVDPIKLSNEVIAMHPQPRSEEISERKIEKERKWMTASYPFIPSSPHSH